MLAQRKEPPKLTTAELPDDGPPLPGDLEEALKDFEGDFRGPWRALGLEAEDPLTEEELRQAYRQAVRLEHPDASQRADAEERFQRVRKAYAILSDEGSRELLLEAIEQRAASFEELTSFGLEEEKEEGGFPWWILWLLLGMALLLLLLLRLASPDMQIRPKDEVIGLNLRDLQALQELQELEAS
ncbi:unnamed protein product [Effrenium voratum]|uniref:J domain-containing protein n=1 Tax=Effrenium voratum TaxID=2562239 RepID=A0AA36NF75_9DINO|nr:unnamed protein product [Effrenium voratum]